MRTDAGKDDLAGRGVECLQDHLAKFAAVDRVGKVTREAGEVHRLGAAHSDFLVRHEGDKDVAVADLVIEPGNQRHDHGDGGLVVRTEHAGAVADDDLFSQPVKNFRMFGDP